jgi:SAM-dependent methyltransferase
MFLTRLTRKVRGSVRGRLLSAPGIGPLLSQLQTRDDYDWNSYSRLNYGPSLVRFESRFTTQLSNVEWRVEGGRIVVSERPLHPRHQLLYELAVRLNPKSVFECGFGGGDHLANLSVLLPKTKVSGADISPDQAALASQRNSRVLSGAELHVLDLTQPDGAAQLINAAEFVYCQAVIMHIHGADRHLHFLRNMWAISERYLFFVEDWERHTFVADLRALFPNAVLYRIGARANSGILIDKQNAMDDPTVDSDRELRRHKRIG